MAPAQSGGDVPAGLDLFETDPEDTVFRFRGAASVPANFFGPGSEPFTEDVQFGGDPFQGFEEHLTGDADTIVRRKGAAELPGPGSSSGPIPIEMVALSLVSVQPITVRYSGGVTERWDVRAVLSSKRTSTGEMTVDRTSARGGTLDSRVTVYPEFIFHKLPDREEQRNLDVGALPDGSRPEVTLTAQDTVWRDGCARPALLVSGLNDDFCPGLTTNRRKVLTAEQTQLAQHGIRPVQPQLEHFKCYAGRPQTPIRQRTVKLTDQFGAGTARVLRHDRLCNPTQKQKERFLNKDAHLQCYVISAKTVQLKRALLLRNQFGPFTATLGKPDRLCVPGTKQLPRGKAPPKDPSLTDHFQCYAIKVRETFQANRLSVVLRDQFGGRKHLLGKPFRLCAPVQKNNSRAEHPVAHLVCYPITGPRIQRAALVRNQFGRQPFVATEQRELCVPSIKVAKNPPAPPRPTLGVVVTGPGGRLVSQPPGIDCREGGGAGCVSQFDPFVTVDLIPMPDQGWKVAQWHGDCAGTPTEDTACRVLMDGNKLAGADFAPIPQRTLTVGVTGNGSVTGPGINCNQNASSDCSQTYPDKTQVTLTPNGNQQNWGGDCAGTPNGSPCTVGMTADRHVGAQFQP